MDTVSRTMSHIEGVSDGARARELFKYYQPKTATTIDPEEVYAALPNDPESYNSINVTSHVTSTKISSPDTALTAFAQLVSWRTGAQRAMISVIDQETQYFIAESTRTVDLVDNKIFQPGDELWIGCSEVAKAGRLCERTIAVPAAPNGEFPAFVVNDLSLDERFNQLPFVTGAPFLKFYAGTPLVTKRGIPIGSLFIVDDRPRQGISLEEQRFMGTMAATIMRHMEMTREVEEHRRGMKMSRGLASFVEGRVELIEAEVEAEDEGNMVAGQFEAAIRASILSKPMSLAGSFSESVSSVDRKEREYAVAMVKTEEALMSASPKPAPSVIGEAVPTISSRPTSYDSASVTSPPIDLAGKLGGVAENEDSEASTFKMVFARAANLIREAFEVDGGSVFYDAQKGFPSDFSKPGRFDEAPIPEEESPTAESPGTRQSDHKDFAAADRSPKHGSFQRSSVASDKPVEVLAFSTPGASSLHGDGPPAEPSPFHAPDERSLQALLRRYPRGKLWTFNEDNSISSSDEDILKTPSFQGLGDAANKVKRQRTARLASEASMIVRMFPGVRQVLFVPLWDAQRARWLSANFTWSNEITRVLSKQSELSFLTAFGNSVMAECSRIDTEIADQKKGDFIGSISHELRSPLHGILASAEFLAEEITEGFAKGLIDTVDSCGRTLLDTINHILDFSKINSFERNWRRSRRASAQGRHSGRQMGSIALRQADIPMMNLFAEIDVSVVTEEIIEGVFAGHVFQNMTAPSFDMVADSRGKISGSRRYFATADPAMDTTHGLDEVTVILDVNVQNYHFTTQPGAFRRVIMNLLGNAMKYTAAGFVKIQLEATEMDDYHPPGTNEAIPRSLVTLTISDSGKGISIEFIRSKLFTPFAQENSLSSGTGLGLSIVRSIVALLEGEIQIKSELGRGTEVKVTLPLLRELPKDKSSGSTPKSIPSGTNDSESVIDDLRVRVIGKSVVLHDFDTEATEPLRKQSQKLFRDAVANFLSSWYGMRVITDTEKADFIIVDEKDYKFMTELARPRPGFKRGPIVLGLCTHLSRYDRMNVTGLNVGYLAKPVGPLKLARALTQLLDGVPVTLTPGAVSGSSVGSKSPNTTDLSNVFEDLSLSPHGREVLDNSRMAADSDNARKALESPIPTASAEQHLEFPFPMDRPSIHKVVSMPADKESLSKVAGPDLPARASVILTDMEKTAVGIPKSTDVQNPISTKVSPRLLLVDDNKINLRLLRTCMRKRQYPEVDEAENGLEAVNAARERTEGYDIIFMDISMPVLDGFGATRQIRAIERERHDAAISANLAPSAPALIIALTGLASSRDQSEAFTSGVDLFLTKPVSFREVGKMLDNWEANRERDAKKNSKTVTIELPTD